LSQAAVAERLGMARTNYLRFESGRDAPSAATLAAMAKVVGIQPRLLTTTGPDETQLRDLRQYTGLNLLQVAQRLGYSAARSYLDIESGAKDLTPAVARRLAKVLGVTQADLWAAWERRDRS
jgi:transcriptional regulator with XRE-family HTH domain